MAIASGIPSAALSAQRDDVHRHCLYGPAASIPFQRYCTSIEAVSPKEAERLVLEEADDELIVAGVLEGEHDMVDEDPTLNPEDAEVASV